jgi:hypothetical protein
MLKSLQTDDLLLYGHTNIQLVLHTEPVKCVRKIIEVFFENVTKHRLLRAKCGVS